MNPEQPRVSIVVPAYNEGDEIVTGPYKTLRGLKENTLIKRDTQKPSLGTGGNS